MCRKIRQSLCARRRFIIKIYLTKSMTYAIIISMKIDNKGNPAFPKHTGDEPHLLREIVRAHQVLMAGFSREVGMPASRFALMRVLADGDAGVTDLARRLGVNAAAVTRQLQEMEAEGLVRRRADPGDGRRSYVR